MRYRGATTVKVRIGRAAALCGVMLLAAIAPAATTHSGAAAATGRAAAPATVPGMPGTPQPPTVLFAENFENRGDAPVRLTNYVGASGERYTADQPWLEDCNGWVASFNDPAGGSGNPVVAAPVADCTPAPGGPGTPGPMAWNNVRRLAQALGTLNGLGNANHAVSAFTNGPVNMGNPGAGLVEFETVNPIPVPAGHFLTFSLNAAQMSCAPPHVHAMLDLFLVNGATTTRVNASPIDPCPSGATDDATIYAQTFTGNDPLLYTGTSVGLRMINEQGSGDGNDHAFDDIRMLDVTPQLDKSFSPSRIRAGGTATLTFTITNTDDLFAKPGWSFTDTLPAGLTLATPADGSTNCPAGNVAAPDGGSAVSVTNGALNAGQDSCTVTVHVTAATAATYTNDAADITASVGLNPPGSSAITFFTGPAIGLAKSASATRFSAARQELTYRFLIANQGTVPLSAIAVHDTALPGLSPVRCPQLTLQPGVSESCSALYRTGQRDVDRGFIRNQATAQGDPPGSTVPTVSDPSSVIVRAVRAPAITVRKSVSPAGFSRAGQVLRYRYLVTSTGNVTLSHVLVKDSLRGLSAVRCPTTTLAPARSEICTATYRVTSADISAGFVRNRAVAHGDPPGSRVAVISGPSVVTVLEEVPVTG